MKIRRVIFVSALYVLGFGAACSSDGDSDAGSDGPLPGGAPGSGGGAAIPGSGGATNASGGETNASFDWQLDPSAPPDSSVPTWPTLDSPIAPSAFWGSTSGARPTNTWWLGLVLETGEAPAYPLPYHVRARSNGVEVGLPLIDSQQNAVFAAVHEWIALGAASGGPRALVEYDDLSVSMKWTTGGGSMTAPLVAGSAYVTMLYEGATPSVGLQLNGTGTRFENTVNGTTWVIYASKEISFSGGVANAPFEGSLRLARLPSAETAAAFDAHAGSIPLRGHVEFARQGKDGIVDLVFETTGGEPHLGVTLPHHRALLDAATVYEDVNLPLLKGTGRGLVSSRWRLRYPLTEVGFTAPRPVAADMIPEITAALEAEAGYDPDAQESVYWAGKALSRLGRLALIADEVGATTLRDTFLSRLEPKVKAWLDRTNTGSSLAYDRTWGGVVNECVLEDTNCDFGQGIYSDHHFHYGYHVYAAAILAKYRPEFVNSHGQRVGWLLRDYVNPYRDQAFARLRHFDFYAGHSWTSGLINFADGRNQESTSEAVHAYYAVQLWGEASDAADWENLGHILRMAETVGAQTYWQIGGGSAVYSPPFSNHACVGIVWNQKVDYATWFGLGDNEEYVCGIQIIPVTPATEDLIPASWVAARWEDELGPITRALSPTNGWRDFFAAARANMDRADGCALIRQQTGYDGGNSRANMLHYCATRP